MRICIIITGMGMGGAETQVAGLADGFAERGHSVLILGLTGPVKVRPKSPAVMLEMLGMTKSPLSLIQTLIKLRRRLKEFQPDVVHSHMVHANLLARFLRIFTPIPRLICTAHSNTEGGRLRMLAYRLTDFLCDGSSNVSRSAVEAFVAMKAVKPSRMVTIYNGIDTARFTFMAESRERLRREFKLKDCDKVILAVGSLSAAKDYPTLLHAFAMERKEHPELRLLIAGEGPLRHELESTAVRLGIAHDTIFLGIRKDIPDLMCAADLFVLSSAWEGFGLVVAEAMACRCPVVATDCGGVAEVIGETTQLVPVRNPDALATAIKKQLNLSSEQKARSLDEARKRVETLFSLDKKVSDWIKIYEHGLDSSNALSNGGLSR